MLVYDQPNHYRGLAVFLCEYNKDIATVCHIEMTKKQCKEPNESDLYYALSQRDILFYLKN